MPIDNIFWSSGWDRDLHLLRGATGPDLSASALVFTAVGARNFAAAYIAAHPGDVTLRFQPLFKGAVNGNLFEAFGIHVDTTTGQVRLDAAVPPQPKNNFIIEVTTTNTIGGTMFNETIRVHVHTSVTRIWLSPSAPPPAKPTMTLRPSAAGAAEQTTCRFTVRAEFDDGTSGDVTLNHGVTWAPAANFNAAGQFNITAANAPGSDVAVTATFPSAAGPQTADGTVHIAQPWASEPARPKISIVPGGGWPGTIAPEEVPNILFLGDGFTAADQNAFEAITNKFVHHIKLDPLVRPFDLLATSINFWRTFMPAIGNGISVRGEVFLSEATKAQPVPDAIKATGTDDWVIENLVYAVGLPVPADAVKTVAGLRTEWQNTVIPDPTAKVGDDDLIKAWQKLSTRAFIDELDRFPAMSYGNPPAANRHEPYGLDLHEDRGAVHALQSFYRPLAADSGVKLSDGSDVGVVWAQKDPTHAFDNTDLVVLITSIPGGRAVNGTGYIAMSTATRNLPLPVTPVGTRKGFTLGALAPPADASSDSCRTLAHELGHSFGLGDEYADLRLPYPTQDDTLDLHANLQTEKSAKGGGPDFKGDEIKWNWPRIRKAAVVSGPITEAAGAFKIPVALGRALHFTKGDRLLLRLRKSGVAIAKRPNMLTSNQELEVVAIANDSIDVKPVDPSHVDLTRLSDFTPGSVVFLPTPAPASVKSATYPYAEMVALNVKNAITNQKRPLTKYPCANEIGPDVVTPDLTGISLPGVLCFKHKPEIVGLYENGARFTCAIYHPAGTCMMRQNHDEHAQFCAVCRYIMVDFINPFRHFWIDLDYGEIYPLE
jgi:hypothetical protein